MHSNLLGNSIKSNDLSTVILTQYISNMSFDQGLPSNIGRTLDIVKYQYSPILMIHFKTA